MSTNKNYYQLLEIDRTASQDQIKKAYQRQASKYHPDKNRSKNKSNEEIMKQINIAFDVLSNPFKRKIYDDSLKNYNDYLNKRAFEEMDKSSQIKKNNTSIFFHVYLVLMIFFGILFSVMKILIEILSEISKAFLKILAFVPLIFSSKVNKSEKVSVNKNTEQKTNILPKISFLYLIILIFVVVVVAKIVNEEESSATQNEQAVNEIFSEKYVPNSNSFGPTVQTESPNELKCNDWFEGNFGALDPTFNNYPVHFPSNKEFNDRMMSVLIQNHLDFLARDYYENINQLINSQELPSVEFNSNLIRNLTDLNEIELANMFKLAMYRYIHSSNFSCN